MHFRQFEVLRPWERVVGAVASDTHTMCLCREPSKYRIRTRYWQILKVKALKLEGKKSDQDIPTPLMFCCEEYFSEKPGGNRGIRVISEYKKSPHLTPGSLKINLMLSCAVPGICKSCTVRYFKCPSWIYQQSHLNYHSAWITSTIERPMNFINLLNNTSSKFLKSSINRPFKSIL